MKTYTEMEWKGKGKDPYIYIYVERNSGLADYFRGWGWMEVKLSFAEKHGLRWSCE